MTASGHLYWTVGLQDPVLPPHGAYAAMQGYVAEVDPAAPLVSPVFCDYTDVIPLFLLSGTAEIVGSDAIRAALDTLGAAVVVPIKQRGQLIAFLCLGPKRSRDIYTSSDLALLVAVADKVSTQLQRMDLEAVVREAREMQQELRRFVPGAVARQVEARADLDPGERSVSVLFVDIRGFVAFSESRDAREIFNTINRYTSGVSSIVRSTAAESSNSTE